MRVKQEAIEYTLLMLVILLSCIAMMFGAIFSNKGKEDNIIPVILLTRTPHDSSLTQD